MSNVASRRCRSCHEPLFAGDPYWEYHGGAHIGRLIYCGDCMMPGPRIQWDDERLAELGPIRGRVITEPWPPEASEGQAERSEP